MYRLWSESWQVLANESGSMTREFFVQFVDYFCERMDNAGYGRVNGPGHNIEMYLDGHTSRWTFAGLLKLIKRGFFPYCIPSHTTIIWQPNDDGPNGCLKGITGRCIHRWRQQNLFGVFDRAAYNSCLAEAVNIMRIRLAANLAAWKAKHETWLQACAVQDNVAPLTGKPGNLITRAWERCGWHPLKKLSTN